MIVESILLSILGSGAYDIVKKAVTSGLGIGDNDLVEKIYGCIDCSIDKFFNKYTKEFGQPEDSFLARQENIDIIIKYMYYSSTINLYTDLNRKGFKGNKDATDDAIKEFISILSNEMNNDMELNKIITEKAHIQESSNQLTEIKQLLNQMQERQKSSEKIDHKWYISNESGKSIEYKTGTPIKSKFGKNGFIEARIMNDRYYVDILDDNGNKAYYEVDLEGNVLDSKFPYDLSEYTVFYDSNDVVRENIFQLQSGFTKKVIKLKWNRNAEIILDSNRRLAQVKFEGGWTVDHNKKIISPSNT